MVVLLDAQMINDFFNFTTSVYYLQAFLNAWNATCTCQLENPKIVVPGNSTFLVHQVLFSGPCEARNIAFLVMHIMTHFHVVLQLLGHLLCSVWVQQTI